MEKLENGWYFLCPKCKEISRDGWKETFEETKTYNIIKVDEDGEIEYEETDNSYSEHLNVEHKCGFYSEGWMAGEFMVKIEDGEIVDWTKYWEDELDTLREIAKEKGLKFVQYRGWYLACPECKEISKKGWSETQEKTLLVEFKIVDKGDGDYELEPEDGTSLGVEILKVEHKCGFEMKDNYCIGDFAVKIQGDTIVDWEAYWKHNLDKLEELAKENGLKILDRGVEE